MSTAGVNRLFDQVDPPLWVVTAADGSRRGGMIATFVSQASIVPAMPRVLVGIARPHQTWELVEGSGAFGLHLLGEGQLDWVWRFGAETGRGSGDKLEGLAVGVEATGAPILDEAPGWLDCRVESRLETGDRTVYLAAVVAGALRSDEPPLRVGRMLAMAPADRLAAIQGRLEHDIAVDAEAIAAWRAEGSGDRVNPRPPAGR